MILDLPVNDDASLGEVNNINMLQLNAMFLRLYLNDLYYKTLIDIRPTVYEIGHEYHENDAIWLNTEWWKEFISFVPHALKCANSLNENNFSIFYNDLTIRYAELSGSIVLFKNQASDISNVVQCNLDNLGDGYESLMKQFIRCAYLIGELSDHTGLYYFTGDHIAQVSSFGRADKTDYEIIETIPVYSYLAYNGSVNMTYISALVRTALSAHANVIVNTKIKTDLTGLMNTKFNDIKINALSKGYNLSYLSSYDTNISDIVSVDIGTHSIGETISDLLRNKLSTTYSYFISSDSYPYWEKKLATHISIEGEEEALISNYIFDHLTFTEGEKATLAQYADKNLFDIHLSSLYDDNSKDINSLTLRENLSNLLKYVICTLPVEYSSGNCYLEVWSDGSIRMYGKCNSNDVKNLILNPILKNNSGISLPTINTIDTCFITNTNSTNISYFNVNGHSDISSVILALSSLVCNNNVKDERRNHLLIPAVSAYIDYLK